MRSPGVSLIAKNEERCLWGWLNRHVLAGVELCIIYDNTHHPVPGTHLSECISEKLLKWIKRPLKLGPTPEARCAFNRKSPAK